MDEMDYLQPSFDPSSLTMPRLRNILMTHNIQYPASAKKTQLVDIFVQELKPQARKLLAARDRVRRTSEGITNMPRHRETPARVEDDETATPRARKSRKSGHAATKESIDEMPETTSKKTPERRGAGQNTRQSDTETDADNQTGTVRRKSRKSEAAATTKHEESQSVLLRPAMPESAFSDENPFQSGSSPSAEDPYRRRSAEFGGEKKRSSSGRRKTEGGRTSKTPAKRQTESFSRSYEMPVSSLSATKEDLDDKVEAGEEFTPEEQSELVEQRAARGGKDVLPPRPKRRSTSRVPKSAPWLVLTSLLVGFGTWYRQEKLAAGYCGVGRPSDIQLPIEIPEWAAFLQPVCEPCPQHATCYQGLETICDNDFILVPHPFSFGGLVPIAPSCEPDGEKTRKVKAVADRAVEALRQRKAEAECGTLQDEQGQAQSAEIPEKELKTDVGKNRRRGMGEAEFEDLWKGAIGEIIGREEVVSSEDGRLLSSTSLARLPLGCAIRRSTRLALARHRQSLSVLTAALLLFAYIRNRIRTSRADAARVPSLVSTTLDRLATQAALHSRGDASESWISVGQLRDDVLRDVFSDSRRQGMWTRVRDIVERNANVRASVREGRGGDVSRVWEWIGSLGTLDEYPADGGAGRHRNRKSALGGGGGVKRVSFGTVTNGHGHGEDVSDGEEQRLDDDMKVSTASANAKANGIENRKWDEGRPIY